ncbi:hypothetical protein [Nodularia sp. UHCC 0506]|uniref:hypothetical protein n=1 Tax=Nodularia sp. UHCC 0506 TaxID=3110243 RepID=UPI002B219089|nr:hypothetical protein [Nodularia sp. UHCC 0506]MEA5517092.1 hypothetical protein [Nodularia sp. UHCC 0506]
MNGLKNKSFSSLIAFLLSLGIQIPAHAAILNIPINTGTMGKPGIKSGDADSNLTWNFTGSYLEPRYQSYAVNSNFSWIMKGGDINSNNNYGSDVPNNMPDFYGVTYLYYTFELPKDATGISLDFSTIVADDRVVLSLNDNELGSYALALSDYDSVLGVMMDGNQKYISKNFDGNGWEGSFFFDDPSLFNLGGINFLRFWVNNTSKLDPNAPAQAISSKDGNLAWTHFRGKLSYNTADTISTPGSSKSDATSNVTSVPESSTILALLAFIFAGTFTVGDSKKSGNRTKIVR